MVLEEVSASSEKETEVEEISVLLTVLQEEPLSLEYWRISPETRAEERVALMVRPSLSVVMKSVELFPESVEMESMETVVVGAAVSTESVTELLASDPSRLLLPAESEKTPEATEITPSVVLLLVGVKVAE